MLEASGSRLQQHYFRTSTFSPNRSVSRDFFVVVYFSRGSRLMSPCMNIPSAVDSPTVYVMSLSWEFAQSSLYVCSRSVFLTFIVCGLCLRPHPIYRHFNPIQPPLGKLAHAVFRRFLLRQAFHGYPINSRVGLFDVERLLISTIASHCRGTAGFVS